MQHNKKRISKIVDELVAYFFTMGATDININLQEKKDYYKIVLSSNYIVKDQEKIEKMIRCLKCDKQEEMEEYFWELAGDCDIDTELTLVGMMTDEAKIDISEDTIKLVLYRYK